MSTDFTVLCTTSPASFLARRHPRLRWVEASGQGAFDAVTLLRRELRRSDELPEESWRTRVGWVVEASGRLVDDASFDAFYAWVRELVLVTQGALFDAQEQRFTYVWADDAAELSQARDEAASLCRARDFAALAALVGALSARHRAAPDEATQDTAWDAVWALSEALRPLLRAAVAEDEPRCVAALLALHQAMRLHAQIGELDALVLEAAELPSCGQDEQLRRLAAQVAPAPATLAELEELLDTARVENDLASLRLARLAESAQLAEWRAPERVAIVIALARSGRALPPPLVAALSRVGGASGALADDALRAELRASGALGRALADVHEANRAEAQGAHNALKRQVELKKAQNDAYYGAKRDRPRTPEQVVQLVKKGRLAEARAVWAKEHREHAHRAAEAVEDARRFFAPKVPPG